MRKDVRELLKAERAAAPKREMRSSGRKRTTGILRAPKAIVCCGCSAAIVNDDAYRTSRGAWCETCAAGFESGAVRQADQPAPVVNSIPTETSWLRPTGLVTGKQIRELKRTRRSVVAVRRKDAIPAVEIAPLASGVNRPVNQPCDACGRVQNERLYRVGTRHVCGDCAMREGMAEERRERAKGDYLTEGPCEWLPVPERKPSGTRFHRGDAIFDWVGQRWLEVVSSENGHDVATRLSAPWWMWNPERAFRFLHGELFQRDLLQDKSWRNRRIPDYAQIYRESVS